MTDHYDPLLDEDLAFCHDRVGTLLNGKWRLEKLLGAGGMAAVYLAQHTIGRRDAIKILHPEIAAHAQLRARFEQEAHAVNRFTHPGAVEVRDLDVTDQGEPFIVMELLEGEDLADHANRHQGMELGLLLEIVDAVLDVLAAAHAQGIVHRDIKLENLFLQRDGRVKVLDFGIARMRDGGSAKVRTRTGITLGTLTYMPPEQVNGVDVDHRADLFAVGACMYRLLAKEPIHDAPSDQALLVKMLTQPAARLGTLQTGAPQSVCDVVDRALAFHADRRYPDAATMQADIRALRRGEAPAYASAQLSLPDNEPDWTGEHGVATSSHRSAPTAAEPHARGAATRADTPAARTPAPPPGTTPGIGPVVALTPSPSPVAASVPRAAAPITPAFTGAVPPGALPPPQRGLSPPIIVALAAAALFVLIGLPLGAYALFGASAAPEDDLELEDDTRDDVAPRRQASDDDMASGGGPEPSPSALHRTEPGDKRWGRKKHKKPKKKKKKKKKKKR